MFDSMVSSLNGLLTYFQSQRAKKEENYKDALLAILEALIETQTYLEDKESKERDRATELKLSKLWDIAAIKISEFNPDLASLLREKGLYWLNEQSLSRRELYKKGIALIQVRQHYEKLCSEK